MKRWNGGKEEAEEEEEGVGWEVQKSLGWRINTAGIIKSPCSALCSPSLVTGRRKRLTSE